MKKLIFLAVFFILHVQAQNPFVVSYDMELGDTTVDGIFEYNIPVFSNTSKKFIDNLYQQIDQGKFKSYYRCNLMPAQEPFIFPLLDIDTSFGMIPEPPFEGETYYNKNITIDYVNKIRIYEIWEIEEWSLSQNNYRKTTIAWSFLLRDGGAYRFNQIISANGNIESDNFEPYVFLLDKKYLPALQKFLRLNIQ